MDACNSMSVLFYRRSKPLGKVRRRVQNLRIPSSSYCDYAASGSKLDLSHNESARFAADSLLCQGLEGYHNMLKAEGEVDFLSELEKDYVLQNGSNANTDEAGEKDKMDIEIDCRSPFSSVLTNSVAYLDKKSHEDVKSAAPVSDDPSAEVFFQSDSSAAAMKDLVRQFLRKAKLALAIVMDSFSDPELLCDLLEASRKRNVSVHLLLDHLNLKVFVNVWQELKLISKNFPKVSVRSVPGQTYCAKTGRKLTGQVVESFIIADWDEVLTGTYSFTWLSGQVHHNILALIKGSSVSHFQQEFVRLNSSSKPVPGFVTFITLPQSLCLYSTSNKPQNTVRKKRDTGLNTERIAPELPLRPSVQPGAEYKMQRVTVGKPQHTLRAACTQLEERAKVEEQWERNQNQFHGHQNLPDPNVFSDIQSQLHSTPVITTAGKNVEVQKPHTLNAMSPTHGPQSNEHDQSALKKKNSLTHLDGSTEGVFPQQRNRNILTEPSGFTPGIETQRNQWDSSLNVYPKVEPLCDQPKLLSPPTSQQIQSKPSLQITFSSPREQMSGVQPNISFQETSKQDEFMKQYHGPLNSPFYAVPSCVKPTPPGIGTCLSPQRQADSKRFLSDVQTKMHLYPFTSQLNLTQRRHWSLQKATGPRVIGCYNSFSGTHVMGQAGWRPLQDSRNTSLGRSLSMMERCTVGYRGAGLHPN
ncbi:hypothetical protein CHARACLAT_015885 [Characodon lateralis]|uniref:Scaffolding anchor of CK1 domain-containing protein n=1 Tax=Characodon lateralis TaxID=208331 RepID=A0ABU7DIU1_9TELE|nr:hypothetical protein [Characodon lateralis]